MEERNFQHLCSRVVTPAFSRRRVSRRVSAENTILTNTYVLRLHVHHSIPQSLSEYPSPFIGSAGQHGRNVPPEPRPPRLRPAAAHRPRRPPPLAPPSRPPHGSCFNRWRRVARLRWLRSAGGIGAARSAAFPRQRAGRGCCLVPT